MDGGGWGAGGWDATDGGGGGRGEEGGVWGGRWGGGGGGGGGGGAGGGGERATGKTNLALFLNVYDDLSFRSATRIIVCEEHLNPAAGIMRRCRGANMA